VQRRPGERFLSSEMAIWRNKVEKTERAAPTVVLFGYAGSPRSHLEKFETLYTSLGYSSVCCILPHKSLFAFNIPDIQKCARRVLQEVESSGAETIVAHCFSNNGVALYQQSYSILEAEHRAEGFIKGLILDSGPGPMGLRDNVLRRIFNDKQGYFVMPFAMFIVNSSNKVPLADNLKAVIQQLRSVIQNVKMYKHIPWPGLFIKTQEKGSWPALVLYSKADALLNWRYTRRTLHTLYTLILI
jgi:hypothetical protein